MSHLLTAILSHADVSLVDLLLPSLRGYRVNSKLVPVLLLIELGLITMKDLVDKIDQQFTINHDQQTLHYKLTGLFPLYPKTLLCHSS